MGRRKKNRAALKKKRKRAARRLKQKEAEAKHAEAVAAWLTLVQMPEEIIWLIVEQLPYRYDAVHLGLTCSRLAEVIFCRGGSESSVRWARKKLSQLGLLYSSPNCGAWFTSGYVYLRPSPISAGAMVFIVRRTREVIARGHISRESAWGRDEWAEHWRYITLDAAKWLLSRDLGPWKVGETTSCAYLSASRFFSRRSMYQNPPVWNLLKSRFRKVPQKKLWATEQCRAMKGKGEVCECETQWVFKQGRTLVPFPEIELDPAKNRTRRGPCHYRFVHASSSNR